MPLDSYEKKVAEKNAGLAVEDNDRQETTLSLEKEIFDDRYEQTKRGIDQSSLVANYAHN
jgi:hypothetical protein